MFENAEQVMINNKRVKSIVTSNGGVIYEEPVSLSLLSNKDFIETGETATLTATLKDAGAESGISITFEVYKGNWLITTITGVTDNSGVAVVNYNSFGVGDINVTASTNGKALISNSVIIEDVYKYIDDDYEWNIISRESENWRLTDFDLPTNCEIEWKTTTDVFVPVAIGDNTRDDDDYPRWVCNIDATTMTTLTADWDFHSESLSFTADKDNVYKIVRKEWTMGFYVNDVLICEQTTHNLFSITTKFRTNVYNVTDFEYVKITYITELDLEATQSIIESGEFSVLTATLRNNPLLISGKTIQLYEGEDLWAELTTDNNGKGTYEYEGGGTGKLNFYVEYGNVQSEIVIVEDCLFYDPCVTGISDLNNYTYVPTSTSSLELTDNGIVFKNVNNSAQLHSNYLIEGDFEIILEAKIERAMVKFGLINENSDITRFQIPVTPLDTFYLYSIRRYNGEVKCFISENGGESWTERTYKESDDVGSGGCYLYLLNYSSNAERVLTFKNIKIFPI